MNRRILISLCSVLIAACAGSSSNGAQPTQVVVDGVYSLPSGTCADFDPSQDTRANVVRNERRKPAKQALLYEFS